MMKENVKFMVKSVTDYAIVFGSKATSEAMNFASFGLAMATLPLAGGIHVLSKAADFMHNGSVELKKIHK